MFKKVKLGITYDKSFKFIYLKTEKIKDFIIKSIKS